tara:strand:+ start:297 stop:479 length:183 start_codon:yes stop_codon:yes gene_type:complete
MVTSYKIERNVFGYSTVLMKIKTLFYIEEIRFYPTEEKYFTDKELIKMSNNMVNNTPIKK